MRVGEGEDIVPVSLIESGQRCQYQDRLTVFRRCRCNRDIVEMVVYHWRRHSDSISLWSLFPVCCCRRRKGIRCCVGMF